MFLEQANLSHAKTRGYRGVFTTNANRLTQLISRSLDYTILSSVHVNQYEDDQGRRPFASAPHDLVYDDPDDLYNKAEELIRQMPDERALEVKVDSFAWLEGFENRAEDAGVTWCYGLDLQMLTRRTGTLQLYVALSLAVGPRSTMACRIAPDGTFYTMIGTQGGGQIGHAIKSYYYPNDAVVSTAFLLRRLADFFYDSAWPDVYKRAGRTMRSICQTKRCGRRRLASSGRRSCRTSWHARSSVTRRPSTPCSTPCTRQAARSRARGASAGGHGHARRRRAEAALLQRRAA